MYKIRKQNGAVRNNNSVRFRLIRLIPLVLALTLAHNGAKAQGMNELLEVLKEKGIITQEEFDRITARQKIQRESDREETIDKAQ